MMQHAAPFWANQEWALSKRGLRLLAAAPIMMDECFFHEVGSAASGTGLINMQARRAAFAAGVRAGEVASMEQIQIGQQFQLTSCAGRRAEKRVLHNERRTRGEDGFDRCVARIGQTQHRQFCAILSFRSKWKLGKAAPNGSKTVLQLGDRLD